MTEVRISSLCERPCAGIEETGKAPSDAGATECSRRRKVHSLIDKVYDPANLAEAWKKVRENKGSAGIDGLTVAGFEQRQDELLEGLHKQLREKTYRPSPVKRVAIPKLGGGTRNLGIPSVRDRVVQQALVQKMNPIFEPLFADCSFGYRPGRSPHIAMRKVWQEIQEGNFWILDADLRAYFDSIDQNRLVDLICDRISDGRVLQLIRGFLEAGVIADGADQDRCPARRGSQPALVEHFPDALRSRHDRGRISGDALGGRLRRCLPNPSRSPNRPDPGGVIPAQRTRGQPPSGEDRDRSCRSRVRVPRL